jgi:mannose-6-phosphate isomerase-like protein (cupin superfamily)
VIRRPLAGLLSERDATARPYLEFIRTGSMSIGLYVLRPGDEDRQQPHTEDEVYVVMAGAASFTAGESTTLVQTGDTLYVEAGVPHRFHDIAAELQLMVVFAPPEGSLRVAH